MKLSVGTDIESVERFQKMLQNRKTIVKRFFFENEYNYAISKVNSAQTLTGIWCAKEAVVKCFNKITILNIKDVEIISQKNSSPSAIVYFLPEYEINYNLSISISHTKDFATAIAVLTLLEDTEKHKN